MAGALEPLPEVTPYVSMRYNAVGLKDPFAPSPWTEHLESVDPVIAVQDCRDPQRPREELERYSLGALKPVGSFPAPGDDALWALIQAPDGGWEERQASLRLSE